MHQTSKSKIAGGSAPAELAACAQAGAAARALSAALPTVIVDEASAQEPEEDLSGSDGGDLSPEGWNNVLAAWMDASGLTQVRARSCSCALLHDVGLLS